MRKNSIKYTRINSEITKAVTNIIHFEVKDPGVSPMASVTDCEVAPDLKTCKVFISVYGAEGELDETLAALKKAGGFIRSRLASEVNLRNTPELIFYPDRSMEYGAHMSELIDKLHKTEENEEDDNQ